MMGECERWMLANPAVARKGLRILE